MGFAKEVYRIYLQQDSIEMEPFQHHKNFVKYADIIISVQSQSYYFQ